MDKDEIINKVKTFDYKKCFFEALDNAKVILQTKYRSFQGTATAKEFWLWFLLVFVVNFILVLLPFIGCYLSALFLLATICPSLGVCIRRFRDLGKVDWKQMNNTTYMAGFIGLIAIVCVFNCFNSVTRCFACGSCSANSATCSSTSGEKFKPYKQGKIKDPVLTDADKEIIKLVSSVDEKGTPWILKYCSDSNTQEVKKYISALGRTSDTKSVEAVRDLLRARVETVKKAVADPNPNPERPMQEKELKNYDHFLEMLRMATTRIFDGKQVEMVISGGKTLAMPGANGKVYFHDASRERTFLYDEQVAEAMEIIRIYEYAMLFFDGCGDADYQKEIEKIKKSIELIREAIKNNKPENLTFHPMPQPGNLNTYADKALKCARDSKSYTYEVARVIVDDNTWTIDYNLSTPVRRKFNAWVLLRRPCGFTAYRAIFCEPYQGNGKYGELKLYGLGGGGFYVK